MPNTQIVEAIVSQQVAPTPSQLQKTGAFISWGGTATAPNTISLLTQPADLTPILFVPQAITSLSWTSEVVTVTTDSPHNMRSSDALLVTISGAAPAAYNGTFLATVTGASTFTYPLVNNPGSETVPGTWATESLAEIQQMTDTFFGQGSYQSVYVLELGPLGPTNAVAALHAFITANSSPQFFYSYLVPRSWDGNSAYLALLPLYENPSAKTYFFTTTTLSSYSTYTAQMKDVLAVIEDPVYGVYQVNALTAITYSDGVVTATATSAHGVAVGAWFQIIGCVPTGYNGWWQAQAGTTGSTLVYNVPASLGAESELGELAPTYQASTGIPNTEFSEAAWFWRTLSYAPGATNKVTPLNYSFIYGVTPYPTFGNSALLQTLQTANMNVVSTGAQGGISNTMVTWGSMLDGNKFNYWYATDWMNITITLNVTNAIINGSNNPVNPLYYNQPGINTLQSVIATTAQNGVTFGLVLFGPLQTQLDGPTLDQNFDNGLYVGYTVVNAIPFITYSNENPGNYGEGLYTGFSVIFTPIEGFSNVQFNLVVTDFVSGV